jgi:hypothetical protein
MIDMETTHAVAHFFGGLAFNKSIKKLMLLSCETRESWICEWEQK